MIPGRLALPVIFLLLPILAVRGDEPAVRAVAYSPARAGSEFRFEQLLDQVLKRKREKTVPDSGPAPLVGNPGTDKSVPMAQNSVAGNSAPANVSQNSENRNPATHGTDKPPRAAENEEAKPILPAPRPHSLAWEPRGAGARSLTLTWKLEPGKAQGFRIEAAQERGARSYAPIARAQAELLQAEVPLPTDEGPGDWVRVVSVGAGGAESISDPIFRSNETAYETKILSWGPAGYWKLGDGGTQVRDFSGRKRHGRADEVSYSSGLYPSGRGRATEFNGTSSVIHLPAGKGGILEEIGKNPFSVALMVQPSTLAGDHQSLVDTWLSPFEGFLLLIVSGGSYTGYLGNSGTQLDSRCVVDRPGVWYQLVFSRGVEAPGSIRFYMNGNPCPEAFGEASETVASAGEAAEILLGKRLRPYTPDRPLHFAGKLAQLAIFAGRSLGAEQAQELYKAYLQE